MAGEAMDGVGAPHLSFICFIRSRAAIGRLPWRGTRFTAGLAMPGSFGPNTVYGALHFEPESALRVAAVHGVPCVLNGRNHS